MANQSPGLNGLCPKRFLSLIVIFLAIALALPLTSAAGWDNAKESIDTDGHSFSLGGKALEYNPLWKTYKPIEVRNMFGYGKTLLRGALTQHTDVCGVDCQSTMQIHLTEDSVLIDDINFYTLSKADGKTNQKDDSWVEQDIRGYQFSANGNPYSLGEKVPAGTYEVRLDGQKSPKRTVDWVIKTQGETLESWATWGNISGGDAAEVILNSPADDYLSNTFDVLFNCSANITGGATVTNISLWTNQTGTWALRETRYGLLKVNYTYDNFQDNIINTTLWNWTLLPLATATETGGYIRGYAPGVGGGDESSSVTIRSELLTNYKYIDNIKFYYYIYAGCAQNGAGSTSSSVSIFGNTIDSVSKTCDGSSVTSYSDSGLIKLIKNGTNFDVYKNDSFQSTITPSNTNISISASASIGQYSGNGEARLYYVEYSGDDEYTWNNTGVGLFNYTIANPTDWTCHAGDSDGDSGFAEYNWSLLLDATEPVINITYPETSVNYGGYGQNFTFNWTASDSGILESCWYSYNNTNTTVTCTDQNISFELWDQQNMTFYANNSIGNEANYTRTWVYKLFGNSELYNLTTYETAREGFKINITADGLQTVSASLIYDGISYTGTKVGNGTYMEFNRNIDIPTVDIATPQNKTFYWNLTYGTEAIATNIHNQSVGRIAFNLCNATLTAPYINFTFEDEETAIATNATIDSSTWYYYLGDGTVNKSLLYSTTSANESYGFCFTPTDKTMKKTLSLQYSDAGYPQRRWTSTTSLTNTTTNQKLYMLASADGTYSVYQVQAATGSSLEGVKVQVERQFSGVWVLVEEGTTDSAGGFTAWLNPDYDHRLTFTKSGYVSQQVTVRPSSSTYTIVMGGGEEASTYNSSMEGLSWKLYPNLGKIILPNTTQTFLFNITANLSNIVSCKMELINNNSVSLGTTTGCNSQGGNLSLSIPVGTNRSIRGIYSVDIGDGYFVLDADAYWLIMTTNIPERGTIVAFFKYVRNLNEFGSDDNRQEYTRVVFFFLMLSIIMGSICYSTGWDFSTAGGSMIFLTFLIIIASYGGFLTLSYTGINGWMDQYVVALITGLITGGYVLNKFAREA